MEFIQETASIHHFNWVDVLAITLFFRMAYIGYQLGFLSELVKTIGVLSGLFVSFKYYQQIGDSFVHRMPFLSIEWTSVMVMVLLEMGLYFGMTRLLRMLEKLVQVSFHNKLDSIGGLLTGLFRAALVTSLVLVACRQLPSGYLMASIEERSFAGQPLLRMAPKIYDSVMPPVVRSIKRIGRGTP